MSEGWLVEQLKTIRNLCETALYIEQEHPEWLPTLLELIFEEAQKMVDEHCVIGIKE